MKWSKSAEEKWKTKVWRKPFVCENGALNASLQDVENGKIVNCDYKQVPFLNNSKTQLIIDQLIRGKIYPKDVVLMSKVIHLMSLSCFARN